MKYDSQKNHVRNFVIHNSTTAHQNVGLVDAAISVGKTP